MLRVITIGIDLYQDKRIPNLKLAANDALGFQELFNNIPGVEITLLLNEKATRLAIQTIMGEDLPRKVEKDDVIIFYYAGHGSPERVLSPDHISRYLITYDTEYERIYATAIDLERDINRWFRRMDIKDGGPRLAVLFFDCCFSGLAGGRTFQGPNLKEDSLGLAGRNLLLKDFDFGNGRLIISACTDTQTALESASLKHGVFTYFLIKTLSDDQFAEGRISVTSLYDIVSKKVNEWTDGKQTPVINGRAIMPYLPVIKLED